MRVKRKIITIILLFMFGGLFFISVLDIWDIYFRTKQSICTSQLDVATSSNYLTDDTRTIKFTNFMSTLKKDDPLHSGLHTINKAHHVKDPNHPLNGGVQLPKPGFTFGAIKNASDMTIGITTVQRDKGDYLFSTLESLLNNAEAGDKVVNILIFIGETNKTYLHSRCEAMYKVFKEQFDHGVIEVISPPEDYYPDWKQTLALNFDNTFERVKWRSKQNLDQVFLMMYIFNLSPTYYLMMEDDVIASKGYTQKIFQEIERRRESDWFLISFCRLGAIGKLFRTSVIGAYASFIYILWNKKPLDWLQMDYTSSMYCSYDETASQCKERLNSKVLSVQSSLFQHMGKFSSLKGKTQNLKDKSFRP